jgi:MFS family permease
MEATMTPNDRRFHNLLLICLASGGWSFSFGVGTQVVTQWLRFHGQSETLIGLNHSCHYLGLAAASLAVPWLSCRLGLKAAPLGMLLCALSLALFPWASGPIGWFMLRLANGAASALALVPLEALVSRDADPTQRARDFSFYAVALTVGGAVGIWLGLDMYRPGSGLAFLIGAAPPTLGALALLRWLDAGVAGACAAAGRVPLRWNRHFLCFGTAWSQGFLEGGMLAFLSSYLMTRGLSADAAGVLMGVAMVGVMLFQVPLSWLADRHGRLPVLLGCYAVVLAGLALVPFCPGNGTLAACLFAFGGCSGAMYPLGLALLGEDLPESSLARAYAWYLSVECVGSQLGAAAMGGSRDLWGGGAMFGVGFAAVALVLILWGLVRWSGRRQFSQARRRVCEAAGYEPSAAYPAGSQTRLRAWD